MQFITSMFSWLNDQMLKMTWLYDLVERLVEKVFGLPVPMAGQTEMTSSERIGGSVHFFIYDTIKIFILLSVLIFTISYIQSFFPPERTRQILGRFKGIGANILGALLGTITPFCSCSSIPLFIGFTSAGLPIGVTFSFLISSPLVDLASVLLLASIFNWRIAIAYVVVGLILAVIGGSMISRLRLEKYVESFVYTSNLVEADVPAMTRKDRLRFARDQVSDIIHKVWLYVLIGVGIGAAIHNWIPENIIAAILGKDNVFSVLIATVVGMPMYADIFGTLPIAEALVTKGVGIGTVLAFMMAVTALSLPSLILLKKVVKTKLLVVFTGIVAVGILIIGYTFNAFGTWFI
ncbi:MAG: permease [Eubacteriales bacterium]|nr:permease [Eubacteriales bacterium]